jgi:3-oxoadipate enol-lactonase
MGKRKLSPECHVADLSALFGHLAIAQANFVGVSHGAYVALAFARRSPEQTERLILCSIGANSTCRARLLMRSWLAVLRRGSLEEMAWALVPIVFGEKFLQENKTVLDKIVRAIVKRNTLEALICQLEAIVGYPPLSQIAQDVRIPSLVISGSDDPLVTSEDAQELSGLLGGRYRLVSEAGHSIPAEATIAFTQSVGEFLMPK